MSPPLNIGVLGSSRMAKRSMLPSILALPELYHLTGVASRNPERAAATAREFQTTAFSSYEALLEQPGLDMIYLPLPNALHAEWIDRALDRDLHVLVEKSLACSASDVTALCRKAAKQRRVLAENFQFRFHRQLSVLQSLLAEGAIGELRCLRADFGFPPFPDADNIRYQAALGGGALLDAGAYPIKLAQILMGESISVQAAHWHRDPVRGVDLWGGGFIRQDSGDLFMEFAFGFDHSYRCRAEVWGSRGILTAHRLFTAPPGFSPELTLETAEGCRTIRVEPDDHFLNMLRHLHALTLLPDGGAEECRQNIRQAELIEQFRRLAHV